MTTSDDTDKAPPRYHYLREHRLAQGLTLDELARRLGTSKGVVSRYETFHRNLTIDLQFRLAAALGLWPTELFLPPGTVSIDALLKEATKEQRDAIAVVAKQMAKKPS